MRVERWVEACRGKWVPLLGVLGLGLLVSGNLLVGYGCERVSSEDMLVRLNALFQPQSPAQRAIYRQLVFAVDTFSPLVAGLSLAMLVAALWARVVRSSRTVAMLVLGPALNTLLLLARQGISHLEYIRVTWSPPPALEDIIAWVLLRERAVDTLLTLSMSATCVLLVVSAFANGVRLLRGLTTRKSVQT
ncbi:hypothetical protein [Myxococcus sp. SDU36]|uniref:hypothetical protein n=1 Tax=Myxococcus sp. SDU36 TaxID=2831967 RepID=UPI0025426F32|nr:hypothetical protein [Myxococcus sp. SDU36]WIG94234.1 hypothetical protein KGD87_27315 [Myxococcus sp. SDU36]